MKPLVKPVQPYHMPQMSAPYKYITSQLDEMGVQYEPIMLSVSQLKNVQKEVDLSKIKSISNVEDKDLAPIWISRDAKILDGHHRSSAKKYKEGDRAKIRAIRIDADDRDGCAYLKVIQDRYEQLGKR